MKAPILNCKIGDVIEYDSQLGFDRLSLLAMIVGDGHRRGHDRWLIQPLGDPRRKPYMIKKIATVWKKVT